MLYESCRIGILPPQQEALKHYGFHGIYHGHNIRDLYHLWQIYIILIIIHHCPVKEIIDWCQRGMFAHFAAGIHGRDSGDGQWLTERASSLKPSCGKLWPEPADIWHECAMLCFDAADSRYKNDPYLRERQTYYIAFGLFNLAGYPDPDCMRHDINIWHEFGLGTCKNGSDRRELCRSYHKEIQKSSLRITIPKSSIRFQFQYPQFEIFWMDYTSGNVVSCNDFYSKIFNREGKFP